MRVDDVLPRREVPLCLLSVPLGFLSVVLGFLSVLLGLSSVRGRRFLSAGLLQQSALRVTECRACHHRALDSSVAPVGSGSAVPAGPDEPFQARYVSQELTA